MSFPLYYHKIYVNLFLHVNIFTAWIQKFSIIIVGELHPLAPQTITVALFSYTSIFCCSPSTNVCAFLHLCFSYRRTRTHRASPDLRSPKRAKRNSSYDQTMHVPRRRANSLRTNRREKQALLHLLRPSAPPKRSHHCLVLVHTLIISRKTHQHLPRRQLTWYYRSSQNISKSSSSYKHQPTHPPQALTNNSLLLKIGNNKQSTSQASGTLFARMFFLTYFEL